MLPSSVGRAELRTYLERPPSLLPPAGCEAASRLLEAAVATEEREFSQCLPDPDPQRWPALHSYPSSPGVMEGLQARRWRGGRHVGTGRGPGLGGCQGGGRPVPTEEAVVLPGALHAAVWQDLQVEAGATVQLAAAQDAVQVRQLRSPGAASAARLRCAPAFAQQRRPLPGRGQQEVGAHLLAQTLQAAQEASDFG